MWKKKGCSSFISSNKRRTTLFFQTNDAFELTGDHFKGFRGFEVAAPRRLAPVLSPVPGLERVAGPLEQVALHHHAVWSVHIELSLGVVIGKVLEREAGRPR